MTPQSQSVNPHRSSVNPHSQSVTSHLEREGHLLGGGAGEEAEGLGGGRLGALALPVELMLP